jgi:hypothetical protein
MRCMSRSLQPGYIQGGPLTPCAAALLLLLCCCCSAAAAALLLHPAVGSLFPQQGVSAASMLDVSYLTNSWCLHSAVWQLGSLLVREETAEPSLLKTLLRLVQQLDLLLPHTAVIIPFYSSVTSPPHCTAAVASCCLASLQNILSLYLPALPLPAAVCHAEAPG